MDAFPAASADQHARREADYRTAARALLAALRPPNPIRPALITADLGLVNGTPTVAVRLGRGGGQRAVYAVPQPVRAGRLCFVTRGDPGPTGALIVVATNYQVDPRDLSRGENGIYLDGQAIYLDGEPLTLG